ncbi:MAG: hypothetical protein Q9191_002616, partial [Dirinaria sp. TL-2023a]
MAPLAPPADLSLSSLELDLASTPPSISKRSATLPLSPLADHYLLSRDMAAPPTRTSKPGAGTFDPHSINNKGFFALFALLGMAMVLAAIWFFFWAKNGGFVFRKGDWEEYKSTVLRRKGPNGTTLSGATKTTALGGGSIVADASRYDDDDYGYEDGEEEGTIDWDEKAAAGPSNNRIRGATKKNKKGKKAAAAAAPRGSKNNNDSDMRAYRHEKPAKVGGLNKEADGSYHHDFATSASTTTITDDRSESTNPRRHRTASNNNPFRPNTTTTKKQPPTTPQHHQKRRENFYQHSPASGSSQRPLRPNGAGSGSGASTPTRSSRQASPCKQQQSRNSRASMPGSWTDFGGGGAGG